MCPSTLILQNECRQLEHAAYWGRFKVLRVHTKSSRIEIHHCISKRCLQPGEPSLYCKVYGWSYGIHFFGNYSTWNQGLEKASQAPSCRYKCHHLPERLNLILCGFISFHLKFSPRRIPRIWDISKVLGQLQLWPMHICWYILNTPDLLHMINSIAFAQWIWHILNLLNILSSLDSLSVYRSISALQRHDTYSTCSDHTAHTHH